MGKLGSLVLVIVLAASTSGCASMLAAIAGGDAGTMRAAGRLDGAFIGAIVDAAAEGMTSGGSSAAGATGEDAVYADGELWICRLEGDEIQEINAHSIEGARAACIMSNDVDLVPNGCDCAPR
ncbi:MAG: hypothetical protein M3Y87_29790 [Myxococcota bacterium]|nr:hypothetical protein [Myxococcota bacterium]